MNIRFTYGNWLRLAAATTLVTITLVFYLIARVRGPASAAAGGKPVAFADALAVIQQRCAVCHSAHPTDDQFTAAPAGVIFDTPEQIQAMAARIKERAVVLKTMPFGNKTGMTDAERELLGVWIDQGAHVDAERTE